MSPPPRLDQLAGDALDACGHNSCASTVARLSAPRGRPAGFPLVLSESAWLCSLLYFPVFCKHEKPAARVRTRGRERKNPAAACRRALGVVSVNTLFSKIPVTESSGN